MELQNEHKHARDLPWKEQRKRLQEWKWKDVEVGNFEDYSFMLIIKWLLNLAFFCMPFVDIVLDGILIHQIYSERENLQVRVDSNSTGSFCDVDGKTTRIVFTAREDTILPCSFVETSLLVLLSAYSFFALLGLIFTIVDLRTAVKIIKSDDVSDSMIEPVAYQLHSVRWYSHFGFFKKVEEEMTYTDQAIIFVYQILVKGKQLIPDVAQFIMALIFSFIINELNTNDITNRSTVITILKILLLVFRLGCLIGCLIAYPFMRLCYVKGRLQVYTSFRIEKVIDLTLYSQKHKFSNMSAPPPSGTEMQVITPNHDSGTSAPNQTNNVPQVNPIPPPMTAYISNDNPYPQANLYPQQNNNPYPHHPPPQPNAYNQQPYYPAPAYDPNHQYPRY